MDQIDHEFKVASANLLDWYSMEVLFQGDYIYISYLQLYDQIGHNICAFAEYFGR
jgi:hypothetical protein